MRKAGIRSFSLEYKRQNIAANGIVIKPLPKLEHQICHQCGYPTSWNIPGCGNLIHAPAFSQVHRASSR